MFETISTFINSNPQIAVALAGAFGLAISGGVMYLLRDVPMKLLRLLSNVIFATVEIKCNDWARKEAFNRFLPLISKHRVNWLSNTYTVSSAWDYQENGIKSTHNLGYGNHLLKMAGKYLLVELRTIDNMDSYDMVSVTTMFWNKGLLTNLLEKVTNFVDVVPTSYELNGDGWSPTGKHVGTKLYDMPLEPSFKAKMIRLMEAFINREPVPEFSKLTILLFGDPGSGKTGLIRAIATQYGMSTYSIDLTGLNNNSLIKVFSSIPANSIILLEDCDCNEAATERVIKDNGGESASVTLSGLLNRLDGISPLRDCLVFLTTNRRDSLDSALIRSGRVDLECEVPMVPKDVVNEYLSTRYGLKEYTDKDLKGSDVYELERNVRYENLRSDIQPVNNIVPNNPNPPACPEQAA